MKLYYAPGTCALACCIALEWANADYEVQKVDYADPAYKKINPLGMVPALDIDGSRAMTQADAILQYIADATPPPASARTMTRWHGLNLTKP